MKFNVYAAKTKNNKNYFLINCVKDTIDKEEINQPIHYIQILDRSGSMYGLINDLIEDCKKTISSMKENDYYSIIWFSSPGEFRTILKGIKNNENTKETSFKVLDSIKSVIGSTCFSEPIKEVKTIIEELNIIGPKTSVTLFTDGQSVTPWSEFEENNRVESILNSIKDKIISFNTIGYGNYCNEKLLQKWSSISDFGEFNHSSKIEDYHEIFNNNAEKARNLELSKLEVSMNQPVYFFTRNMAIKYKDGKINLNNIDKNKNQFLIVTDDDEIDITINNEKLHCNINNEKKINKTWFPSLVYKAALAEYIYGDRYEALKYLASVVKDKPLSDNLISAFSSDEIEDFKRKLKNAAIRGIKRNLYSAPENYLPSDNVPCLLDLFIMLSKSKNNKYVISKNYKRIGRKSIDENNIFHANNEIVTSPIENIVFNEKKLNISIGFEKKGYVNINEEIAKKVNLPTKFPTKIIRNHTIVKDGNLNMDEIEIIVNPKTYNEIIKNFNKNSIVCTKPYEEVNSLSYYMKLNLREIPIINGNYGKASIEELFKLVCKENKLKSEIKLAKTLVNSSNKETYEQKEYTEEQAAVLESLHIKNGVYNGFGNKVPSVEDSDFYMSKTFETKLKGFSTIPPIILEENIPKISKETTNSIYLTEALKNYEDYNSSIKLDGLKHELNEVRGKIAAIKIAKTLTGQWFDKEFLKDTKKDDVKIYNGICPYTNKELTLNIKTNYEKSYF